MAAENPSGIGIVLETAKRYISESERLNRLRQRPFVSIQFAASAIGLVVAARRMEKRGAKTRKDLAAMTEVAAELLSEARTLYKAEVVNRWCKGYASKPGQNPDIFQEMWAESERETAIATGEMERIAGV